MCGLWCVVGDCCVMSVVCWLWLVYVLFVVLCVVRGAWCYVWCVFCVLRDVDFGVAVCVVVCVVRCALCMCGVRGFVI